MKVNKSYLKNHTLNGSRFIILLASLALSLPHATAGHYIHPLGHAHPVEVRDGSAESAPMTCTVVACAAPGLSPVSSDPASEPSGPPDILPDILIDAFLGNTQIVFERRIRKAGTNPLKYLVVKLEQARVKLASLIDATLGFGSPEERAQFRRDASAIGIAPDCSPQEP